MLEVRVDACREELAMNDVFGDRVLQCSDGHLFVSSQQARLFGSIHFGAQRLMRCPVDGKWRMASNVNRNDLTEGELREAQRYRV